MKNFTSFSLIALLGVSTIAALEAQADLQLCNGTWTNRPCEVEAEKTLDPVPVNSDASTSPVSSVEDVKRQSLLHELTMKMLSAKREHEIRYDISEAERACRGPAGSLDDCRNASKKLTDDLEKKIQAAQQLEQQEEQLRLQREANALQEERNKIEAEKPAVTIIQPRSRRYWQREEFQAPQQSTTSSVSVQGSVGGVSVSIEQSTGAAPRRERQKPPAPTLPPLQERTDSGLPPAMQKAPQWPNTFGQ